MSQKAYLVATLKNVGTPFPVVSNVGIYSSSALGLTTGYIDEVYADLLYAEGPSYSEAAARLVELIEKVPTMSWVLPWIDNSAEAHSAKYYWQILPRRSKAA